MALDHRNMDFNNTRKMSVFEPVGCFLRVNISLDRSTLCSREKTGTSDRPSSGDCMNRLSTW